LSTVLFPFLLPLPRNKQKKVLKKDVIWLGTT